MTKLLPLLLLLTPAVAAAEGFTDAKDRLEVKPAGISVPRALPGLAFVKTAEFSRKGEGLDNSVQWESSDHQIYATAYVYRPAIADAAFSAWATDRAVRLRFGPKVAVAEQASVAVAGRPGTMIRTVYRDAAIQPTEKNAALPAAQPLTTAAAFARVGAWIVKLRASGPAARSAEVVAALDAMIAGIGVARVDALHPTRPMAVAGPCPAVPAREAKLLPAGTGAEAMLGAMMGGDVTVSDAGKAAPATFPDEGRTAACVRGTLALGDGKFDILQPAGTTDPDIQLVPLSDSGTTLVVQKATLDDGYQVKLTAVGQIDQLGRVDAQPSPAQLQAWLGDRNAPALATSSRTLIDAAGKRRLVLPGGLQVEARRKN